MADSMPASELLSAARQDVETARLMGVPFVPLRTEIRHVDEAAGPTACATASSTGGAGSKAEALETLRTEHDACCPLCTTVTGITQTVFGEGNPDAAIMFVGEAPGAEEDRTGRPFVGRAGQKLEDMIRAMGLQREDVFIANVLKSRPPNNRTPMSHEVAACSPYLTRQVRIIEPKVIVALGGPATKLLLDTDIGITRLRGQWAKYAPAGGGDLDIDGDLDVDVMPTFHPAYLLRNYTRETRERIWSDLQAVIARVEG